jgi:hypothetical protein
MPLLQAFVLGHLPQYGVASLSLHDRTGNLIGWYHDQQAWMAEVTLQ